jgi:uncharacterized protein YhjY with autotransporter beta-barrel domain
MNTQTIPTLFLAKPQPHQLLSGSIAVLLLAAASASAGGWGSSYSSWGSSYGGYSDYGSKYGYGDGESRLSDRFPSRLSFRFSENLSKSLVTYGSDLTDNQRSVARALASSPQSLYGDFLRDLRIEYRGTAANRTSDFLRNLSNLQNNSSSIYDYYNSSSYSYPDSMLSSKDSKHVHYVRPINDQFIDVLNRLSPDPYSSIFTTGFSQASIVNGDVGRRISILRTGINANDTWGPDTWGGNYSVAPAAGNYGPTGARGPQGKGSKELVPPPPENRWGVFATGMGEFTKVRDDDANARGFDIDSGGFVAGVDYRFTNHFALGIYGGYTSTGADLTNGGRMDVDSGKFGIYGTFFAGGFYVNQSVGVGYNTYSLSRSGFGGKAHGKTEGADVNVLFSTGYDWKMQALSVGLLGSFEYNNVGFNSFQESGSLAPLRFPKQNQESIRSVLGGRASYDMQLGGVVLRPEVRVAWQHEYSDDRLPIEAQFANGANFTVFGPTIGRDSLLVGAGFVVLWNERTSTYVYYDGDLARSNYESNNVSGGVRLSF